MYTNEHSEEKLALKLKQELNKNKNEDLKKNIAIMTKCMPLQVRHFLGPINSIPIFR